ncbi:cytochrome P450 [bacterium]|nr:cytochrome P450 [bacterium]
MNVTSNASRCPFLRAQQAQPQPAPAKTASKKPRPDPSPSLVQLAEELGVQLQRGPSFWRSKWRETDIEKAIELANTHQPLRMRVPGGEWKEVEGLDELNQMVAEARRELKREQLAEQGQKTATQAALAAAGQVAALAAIPDTREVSPLSFGLRALKFTDSPAAFLREAHAKHGPSFTVDLPTKGHLLFDTRLDVLREALLNTDSGDESWKKSELQGHGASFLIGKKNMFLSGGQDWKFIQETLRPHLSGKLVHSDGMVDKLSQIFDSHIENLKARVAAAPNGELEINPREEMQRAVLDVALQVFLGTQFSDAELGKFQKAFSTQIDWLTKESINPTDISLSKLPGMGELRDAYKTLNSVDRLIEERKASPERPSDMLTGLIEAVDPSTGQPMDSERLRHEVLSLLEAGHETTATLMGWSLLMLARHPEEYTRLQKEIDQKLGSRRPTFKELSDLKQADNVTDESLRLYPPFYLFMREATQDMTVGPTEKPVKIENGTTLVTNLYVTNRDEQVWGSDSTGYPANEFHSDRFNSATPASAPFGAGRRACIGQALGRLENNLLMCRFAQTFDMSATSQEPIQLGSDLSIHSHAETVKIRLRKENP